MSSTSSKLPSEVTSSATYKRKAARQRRTNIMLTCVSLLFFLAWAPIHVFLIIMDGFHDTQPDETILLIYACCHLSAMTTVCVNPLLYGWCNTNFKEVITTTTKAARRLNDFSLVSSSYSCINVSPFIIRIYSRFRAASQN